MTRFTSFFVVAGLSAGLFCFAGCESSDNGHRIGHDAQFGVGDGEFGTTTTIAGDYPSDLDHAHKTPPADSSH